MKNTESKVLMEKILALWNQFSKTQKIISVATAILSFSVVVGGGVLVSNHLKDADVSTTETSGTDVTEVFGTEVFMTEMTEATEMEVIQTVSVTLTATSFEKDLKIKILDENKTLIAGQPFVITVTPEGSEEGTEYNDHDMDGIIYIKSIAPGKYTVSLQELEGFVVTENPITATVKDKIVYEKVEIKDEIKDESQVDASKEEAAGKGEKVENAVKDTIPLMQSTTTADEVGKDQVDFTNFPDASVSSERDVVYIEQTEISLPKSAVLYTAGKDTSKTATILLNKVGDAASIKDIKWMIDGVDVSNGSQIIDVVVAQDNMSAVITMKSVGQAKLSVVISYEVVVEESVPDGGEDTNPDGSEGSNPDEGEDPVTGGSEGNEGVEGTEVGEPVDGVDATSLETRSAVMPLATTKIETKTVTCNVTVSNQSDSTTPLKDVNGNTLYLDSEGTQVATLKDYDTAEKFYTNPKYTGWQTIDGKLYYFKEDHTYATGKQIIGGVEYEFDETGYLITKEQSVGIDVSKWQGDIDWEAVADSGIDFAIIRCGYRGISTGSLIEDKYFKENIKGATENGIKVGVYVYSQAVTKAEAIEEASMAIELVKGYSLQLPIYIDTEGSGGRGDDVSKEDRTAFLKAFCETVKNAGYKPGIYSGKWWFSNKVNASELEHYHIWIAQYNTECTYDGRYDIWQYTSDGKVPGIDGRVDMNIAYRVYH